MIVADVLDALGIPPQAHVDQRVPKKLLIEHGAPTAADKRALTDGIEEIQWVAALKPTTVGVAAYQDDVRDVLEIAVLTLSLRPGAKKTRMIELVHRAIPYVVVLITEQGSIINISLAEKRWSQGQSDTMVLDGPIISVELDHTSQNVLTGPFLTSLALARQLRTNLMTVYGGWMNALFALQAAHITGAFIVPVSLEHAVARREALDACAKLAAQIASVRAAAVKEKQIARQVDLNRELKRLETAYAAAQARL